MNNDVQASQVPAEYLEDTEDVAAAKVTLDGSYNDMKVKFYLFRLLSTKLLRRPSPEAWQRSR